MRIHVVAVAGTGMGSLAGLLKTLGHDVSGSDVAFDPPMGPALSRWGIRCATGYDPRHLDPAPDLVVIGNVCRRDNPEARAAIDGGLRYTHLAGALEEFVLRGAAPLVVAGTHGKTTTSALAAWLLHSAGLAPGFLIGGLPKNFAESFRAPRRALPVAEHLASRRGRPFVLEGDEYDTAFFEKTPKFLHYRAQVAIVTSIEHDHVDIYPSFDAYVRAFRSFVDCIPPSGLIVANAADPHVVDVVGRAAADVAWYALQEDNVRVSPHWLAAPSGHDESGLLFDLFAGGSSCGRYHLPLFGKHNLRNALAAIGAVVQGYGAPVRRAAAGLARFAGVRRRQDLLGTPRGVFLYDDFAHHPTAVRETLTALRTHHANGRLLVAFEPRSATACRSTHQGDYARSFSAADEVLLAPLGRCLPEGDRLDTERLCSDLRKCGTAARPYSSSGAILDRLVSVVAPGDVVALLSNGAFDGIHAKLMAALEHEESGTETVT